MFLFIVSPYYVPLFIHIKNDLLMVELNRDKKLNTDKDQ